MTTSCKAGIDNNHSTAFALPLVIQLIAVCGQKWIQFEQHNSPRREFAGDGKDTLPFNKFVKYEYKQNV